MSPEFQSLGSLAGAVGGVTLLLAAAFGVGGLARRLYSPDSGAATLFRLTVGLNAVAWLGVTLGQLGWLSGGRSLWLLAGCALLGLGDVWNARQRSWSTSRLLTWVRGWPRAAWASLGVAVLVLGSALSLPTAWDEMVYHHVLPQRWLADGWPAFYPDLPYSGFPSLGEILFWLVAPLDGVFAPRLIVWVCWGLSLMLVYRLFRRRLRRESAGVLALVFQLSGTVLLIGESCYVESLQMLNVTALLVTLDRNPWRQMASPEGRTPWRQAMLLGLFAGGAVGVKLTGIASLALPAIYLAVRATAGRLAWRRAAAWLAIALGTSAIVAGPFYWRPWWLTGNPWYPYYAAWFTSDPVRLEVSRYHHALGSAFGFRSVVGFLEAPLLMAFDDVLYDGTFGWQLPLLFLPAALAVTTTVGLRRRFVVWWPAAAALWLYGFWFLTSQQSRFLVPALLPFVALAAVGLRRFRGPWRTWVLGALLAAAVVGARWKSLPYYLYSWQTVVGKMTATEYVDLATDGVYVPLVQALREHTSPNARLLLLFEHRRFYLPRSATIGTPFFQERGFTPPEQFNTPESIIAMLRREGITHVVMTNAPAGPDQAPAWFDRLEHLLPNIGRCVNEGRLRIVWRSERYLVLEVVPAAP